MKRFSVFAASVLAVAVSAQATLTVDFRIDGDPVDFGSGPQLTIVDNSAPDTSPTLGVVIFQYTSDSMDLHIVAAQSNAPGQSDLATLEINSLSISNRTDSALTVSLVTRDSGFVLPGAIGADLLLDSRLSGTFTNAIGGSSRFSSSAAPTLVSTADLSFTSTTALDNFDQFNSAVFTRTGTPFTLSNELTITIPPRGQANLSGTTTVIPEPAALGLLAPAMLLLARRRR